MNDQILQYHRKRLIDYKKKVKNRLKTIRKDENILRRCREIYLQKNQKEKVLKLNVSINNLIEAKKEIRDEWKDLRENIKDIMTIRSLIGKGEYNGN